MNTINQANKSRLYYIDWLRILLILSVFLFHVGMIFNSWDWHIKNDVTYGRHSVLWYAMVFLGRWRMPLLILISGAGTFLALGKRSSWQFIKERYKRLMIPLSFGIFLLVPVQVYLERADQYASLWDYMPHMFEGIYPEGNFSWHHLWFIAYLFFISLLISPLLRFFRSPAFNRMLGWLEGVVSKKLGANVFLIPILASQVLLRPHFPENTHALVNDWAAVCFFLLFFVSGFILVSRKTMMQALEQQRFLYLAEAVISTALMFKLPGLVPEGAWSSHAWFVSEAIVAWSCGLAALGFAKRHLNFNNRLLQLANEAIYPFYLLHQPIIVIMAYLVVPGNISAGWKAFAIASSSFLISLFIYWYFVRPFNMMRFVFGMKSFQKKQGIEKIRASLAKA